MAGTNAAYAEVFAGALACKAHGLTPIVRLKVSSSFPTNARFCLVPANEFAFRETCFTINGQADITLDPAAQNYGSLVLLAESDLNSYKMFLNYQIANAPPRAIALMNQ